MKFQFFDGAHGLGRCNRQPPDAPTTPEALLKMMDRYDIAEAMVYDFMARDCDPELGNRYQYAVASRFPERFTALTMLRGDQPSDWPALIENGL